jgi:glycosyltransferase involved in cell wall biosynthesis
MVKLSIVTTTFNQEKYIREALDGFLMQKTNFPFKVLISDDGSTDRTPEILVEYMNKYPNIIFPILGKQNVGAQTNFVNTLSIAKSEYVALCDGDDYWIDENKLQKQVDFLDSNKEYSICFHKTKVFFEDNSRREEIGPKNVKVVSSFSDLIKENYIPANTVVYRWRFGREENISGIIPRNIIPGDYFVHLLHAQVGQIYHFKEVMSCYRRHSEGIWWLSSQPSYTNSFYIKYGRQYISFYREVENYFNLDKRIYIETKKQLMTDTIKCYTKNKMFEELLLLKKENPELFDKCIKLLDFSFDTPSDYQKLNLFGKTLYLVFFNRKKLKDILFQKIGKCLKFMKNK